jgi:hypothetical protein
LDVALRDTTLRQRFPAFDRTVLIGRIAEVVDHAKASGQITTTAESEFVARGSFLYSPGRCAPHLANLLNRAKFASENGR